MGFLTLKTVPIGVVIRSRQKLLFAGNVAVVSSSNERGVFDILPHHTNFVSLVKEYIEVVTSDRRRLRIQIERGILRVKQNAVEVYVL